MQELYAGEKHRSLERSVMVLKIDLPLMFSIQVLAQLLENNAVVLCV